MSKRCKLMSASTLSLSEGGAAVQMPYAGCVGRGSRIPYMLDGTRIRPCSR